MGSDTLAAPPQGAPRLDRDVISRFATCCRALGLTVNDRQRPADLDAARAGFAGLTRIAHDHCDAWAGLAAAGDVSGPVIDAVWRTRGSAGRLQREIDLAAGALGFLYDSGLYLQFRACEVDDFQLAYAGAALRHRVHAPRPTHWWPSYSIGRPGWLNATWLRVAFNHHAERWSDVVRLLTPVVTNPSLDERHRARRAHHPRYRAGPARHAGPRVVVPGGAVGPDRGGSTSTAHWPRR